MKKSKWKIVLCVVLAVVLLAGGVAGYFAMGYQPPVQITDLTGQDAVLQDGSGQETTTQQGEIPTQAILSPNVTMFSDAESAQINNAIVSLDSVSSGVEMEITAGSAMDELGIGDIFYLPGDANTPFGMTYIGKVSSMIPGNGVTTYMLETPMMDEVFDVLSFSENNILRKENLIAVECVPGVSLVDETVKPTSNASNGNPYYNTLSAVGAEVVTLDTVGNEDPINLVFETEIDGADLLKLLGVKAEPKESQEKCSYMEADAVKVYLPEKGKCYHTKSCFTLKGRDGAAPDLTNQEVSVKKALADGYKACSICNPPLMEDDEGVCEFDAELSLTGTFGVKDLMYSATLDWNVLEGGGMKELSFNVTGTFTAGVTLEGNLALELGGRTTQYKLLNDKVSFEGLKEHLIPLAAVHYAVGLSPVVLAGPSTNVELRTLTGAMPLSIVGIVYADLQGNITAGFTAGFQYDKPFEYRKDIVKNGKFVFEGGFELGEEVITANIDVGVSAEVDFHVGCGLDLYIFNLKVAQLDVAKVGVEAAGEAKLICSNETRNGEVEPYHIDGYVRGYLKLLHLQLGVKATEEVIPLVDLSFDLNKDMCLLNHTLFFLGEKNDTQYNAAAMKYTHIAAKDADATYFKDTDGKLFRTENEEKKELYSEEFYTICGIDASYIYLLEDDSTGSYNIRRVAKDRGTNKVVLQGVDNILTFDEKYIYFVSSFDGNTIQKFDRREETTTRFAKFSSSVMHMEPQGENFYVAAGYGSILGFSGSYYLLDKEGNQLADYGSYPAVENLEKHEYETYTMAKQISASGYLRDTAERVYWVGRDGSNKKISANVGWNFFDAGIFTMENQYGSYDMVLYQAANGEKVKFTTTTHGYALFTLMQDPQGRWYFFDQTDTEITLYTIAGPGSVAQALKSFSLEEFPCNLSDCGVVLMDNMIYFYNMPNSQQCQVLHRYKIY